MYFFYLFCFVLNVLLYASFNIFTSFSFSKIALHKLWGSRHINQSLYPDKTPNECPEYETQQSDENVPVILELWGMQITP